MARISIKDLPKDSTLDEQDMKKISGGSVQYQRLSYMAQLTSNVMQRLYSVQSSFINNLK